MTGVFAITYGVELLCTSTPTLTKPPLLASLSRYCPGVEPMDPPSDFLGFAHPMHRCVLVDADLPAQTIVMVSDRPPDLARLETGLQQAWDLADAHERVHRSASSVLVTDLMSSGLPYRERVELLQGAVRAVLECTDCCVMRWHGSDRLVDPQAWVQLFDGGDPAQRFLAGAVNVRMFRGEDGGRPSGDLLMDTLGLGALGLPDLQCHCRGLAPGEVARLLYNTAWYLFCEGDVIADGHTLAGLAAGSRWQCRHEDARVAPAREVLDLDPGPPFAAGARR